MINAYEMLRYIYLADCLQWLTEHKNFEIMDQKMFVVMKAKMPDFNQSWFFVYTGFFAWKFGKNGPKVRSKNDCW